LTTTVSSLAGSPVSGTWSLRVADGAAQDTGTLNGWSLAFTLGGEVPVEVCDDGVDNNANGDTDCADEACLEAESCATAESVRFDESVAQAIPDNSASGISSIIEVDTAGTIETLRVDVKISHSYSGDLRVVLENEAGTTVVLYNKEGGSQDNLVRTFTPVAFNGTLAAGLWSLTVSDNGRLDVGTFNSWALEIVTASR
jgi:subtilisin-like proprotein convertase family protein